MASRSRTLLPRVGLIYLGIGASLALLWGGWHADLQTLATVVAWPVLTAIHLAIGLLYTALLVAAVTVALVLSAVAYWEITQRQFERRMGLKREGDTMVYVGRERL